MHVETMARNESLHKQLESKEASIAILKKNKKKNSRSSEEGGKFTNKRADIIDSKRGISGVNNPTTQRVITSTKTSHHNDNTTNYHCFNRGSYCKEGEGQECGNCNLPMLYVPKGKVQVFSTTKMARYGEGLKCNHKGIGNHAIVNHFTGDALNCRDKGDVISNKTSPDNKTTVRLPPSFCESRVA